MQRPLMQHGVGQLEDLFAKSSDDQEVLQQLENELRHRQVPRAVTLLAKVRSAITKAQASPPSAQVSASTPQASVSTPAAAGPVVTSQAVLWTRESRRPLTVPLTPASAASTVRFAPTDGPKPVSPQAPTVPLQDAYRLLKATPGSAWESIEQTRRLLVGKSHPERLRALTADQRQRSLAEAKQVNDAYAVVSQSRCAA
jgi:hypothetical protein